MEDIQTFLEKVKTDVQEGKSDEEIFLSLLPYLGKDLETDAKLTESLATISHEKVGKLLQRMLVFFKEKKVRKIIKRSLYRLKVRGIAIEEFLPEEKSILHPFQAEPPMGFGSGIDFLGQRLLVLIIPRMGRGWIMMQGVVSDTKGWVDFSGEEINRKGFKAFLKEIQKKSPFPLAEMEPSYVAFLFFQAHQLTLQQGRPSPQAFLHFKKEIEGIKREYERPLIHSYLQMDEEMDDWILAKGGDLLKTDFLNSWRIEEDQVRPYADEIWKSEESKIILTPIQKEARIQEIYQKALSELFSEERKGLYQKRLKEMAYLFFKLGREEEAKIALSSARDLEKPLNPFQPNPFLLQLVIKSIFTLLAEDYEKKVKEPSMIVKP